MADRDAGISLVFCARAAGLLYLVIIFCGIFSELFVRSSLIVAADAAATAAGIAQGQMLFRTGFAADALMLLSDVAVAVLFYVLFRPVNKALALMAAAFRLTQAAVLGANLLNYYAALLVLNGGGHAAAFGADERNTLAMLLLDMHSYGYDLGLIFFGVSLFILGYLAARSGYVPALLGYGLQAAAVVYAAGSFTRFLLPALSSFIEPFYVIPFIAELSFGLWLLIRGVSVSPSHGVSAAWEKR